ncbi:hypothetical protein NW767_011321 [Fusarium falciforme]|nr:hypothetical protein NW767_011321 [Fusarium falciforme]
MKPTWVPPNVRFEIDDATQPWTWNENHFDFIHLRYLFGAIKDWGALFKEAYRCATPGGWVQTVEADIEFRSDDDTIKLEPAFDTYHRLFREGGKALGSSFFVHEEQTKGFQEAGFEDVKIVDIKVGFSQFPCGGWPKDPKLAEVGRFVQLTFENDVDGYTTMMWHDVLKWPKDEYQLFLMGLRKAVRNPKVHSYLVARYIYGRKPDHGQAA